MSDGEETTTLVCDFVGPIFPRPIGSKELVNVRFDLHLDLAELDSDGYRLEGF